MHHQYKSHRPGWRSALVEAYDPMNMKAAVSKARVDPIRSANMRAIRARDTSPELRVRSALHRAGYRFRLHLQSLPGAPDVVLRRHRTVIFIHGCFWHQHRCLKGRVPRTNRAYWLPKLARNKRRDARSRRALRKLGWRVIVIWECQTRDSGELDGKLERVLVRQ
jgi:DNA mismatch endonuclease (patch repair protein)